MYLTITVHLPPSVASQFDKLQTMLDIECADQPENLASCSTALTELRELYRNLRYFVLEDNVDMGRLWRWSTTLPIEFLTLIKSRYQPALVIVAYFAAANTLAHTIWFVNDWSQYALRGVGMELEERMQQWLDWPRRQVQNNFSSLREET